MSEHVPNQSSRLPAYQRIARLLRERLASGVYQADEFLPAERELAWEFQASRQTVRLAIDALRHEGLVVPEQGRGTRVVDPTESAPPVHDVADQFRLAALIIYGMSREGSAAIFQGCQAVARQADYHLIVCETAREWRQRAADEAAHIRALLDKGIGGFIIYAEPTDQNRALLQEALDRNVQVVQIDRFLPGLDCDYVGVDNDAAARAMVNHLWGIGHRRIAFLSIEPEPTTALQRRQGYEEALRALGVPETDPDLIAYCQGPDPEAVGRILPRWLALREPPTAIFAVHDGVAVLVMQALRERGLRIPDDIAVAGFDNQYVSRHLTPPLTTVGQPFRALGETAAQMLLDRMAGRYRGVPRRVLLPTELIVRQSCGASPTPTAVVAVRAGRTNDAGRTATAL